ncbi:MAG TPA: class I SAM-dependent methyltransferase [Stellaceae bacterium]|nr:class I SAM-dependent methyltransferase [Stellaceae bacterium]
MDGIKLVHRTCPLCSTENSGAPPSRYSLPPWNIRECVECGFVYIDSAPEYVHLAEELDWDTTYAAEAKRKAKTRKFSYKLSRITRWRMRLIHKRTPSSVILRYHGSGRIVDLGCGSGGLIADLLDTFEPYGVEISKKLAQKADMLYRQHGGRAENAPCLAGLQNFPDNYFEAAVARSYFEHEAQPLAVMEATFRVLKPGGIIVVKVPNYASLNRRLMGSKWCGFRYPDHLNYFTPGTLKRMAEKCGFSVRSGLFDKLPTSDNMWAVLMKPV